MRIILCTALAVFGLLLAAPVVEAQHIAPLPSCGNCENCGNGCGNCGNGNGNCCPEPEGRSFEFNTGSSGRLV